MSIVWNDLWPAGSRSAEWSHSGIAVTDSGTVVTAEPGGGGLVLLGPDGTEPEHIPLPLLEIHGIHYFRGVSTEWLWLADPGFKARPALGYDVETRPGAVGRLDLRSRRFEPVEQPAIADYAESPWQPTSVVTEVDPEPGSRSLYVADGYGASLVHLWLGGRYATSLDGTESGTRFACPHGIVIDSRGHVPTLVVADRGNARLVVYSLRGAFIREIRDPLMTTPSSLALRGNDLLVTELDGALLAVDRDDTVRPLVVTRSGTDRPGWPNAQRAGRLVRPDLAARGLNSPHGIAVSQDGRIFLTEWVIGGRLLELTLP
ncbi:hypothetical protein AX769_09290 [Frondihabitans sp. PAMC 28766]|uniref:hypothetical protein n=1 Tax=Frondihabitans sp. PAMC 28766 TaxID=1795630 RepID=UPI00078B1E3C|nr:hypothetical protein [Frondihabitans sp. PAMC 28766]AMM20321.1 hypothetical protein AX769_09290 [Frondihabitans sp. PAMC 28766]